MSDARLRELERAAVQSGTAADIQAWIVEGERQGHPAGVAWREFDAQITEAEFRRLRHRDTVAAEEHRYSSRHRYGYSPVQRGEAQQHARGRTDQAQRLSRAGGALLEALPRAHATSWALQLSPLGALVKRVGAAATDYSVYLISTGEVQGTAFPYKQPECMSTLRGGQRRCRGVASATLLFTAPVLGAAYVCSAHVSCPGVEQLLRTLDSGRWDAWANGDVTRCTYHLEQAHQAVRPDLAGHVALLYHTARFPVLMPAIEARGRLALQTIWSRANA